LVVPVARRTPEPAQRSMVQLLLELLKAEGVTHVFGVPGGLLHPFFDAVECDGDLELIVNKHEGSAAFMADGYARVSHELAVVAATSGPGATNLLTGVAVAFSDGVPLLVLTGQAPSHSLGRGAAQETPREDIDIVGMLRPITKYSALVESPERLQHHFRRALRLAHSGRPGPVHLNVPVDLWSRPVTSPAEVGVGLRAANTVFDRQAVCAAARLLLGARRPALLLGSGASGEAARERAIALAEALDARVATTPRAKGAFPEDHPLSLGVLGFGGADAAREALLSDAQGVDVVFVIGASLNETTTINWHPGLAQGRKLIQLDIDAERIGRNYPVAIPLLGDAGTVLLELLHQLRRDLENGVPRASSWPIFPKASEPPVSMQRSVREPGSPRASAELPLSNQPRTVHPAAWREELNRALPDNAIVFSDIGGHMLFNIRHLRITRRQSFVLNLGFGSMGHGTVAPIGAAMACPGRPVIAIIGDACFAMNGMELLTAVEHNIPVVWVVEDNQMHGISFHGSKLVNGGRPMLSIVNLRELKFRAFAEAMGLAYWEVSAPGQLGPALSHALAGSAPSLIHVRVDGSVAPPLGDRAKTVAGFKR
jgi:acetolactate synthase-1/2/3 large subunit